MYIKHLTTSCTEPMPSDPLLPLEQQRPEQEVPIANKLKLPA